MKISAAALSFLILATALGSPAHGSRIRESLDPERAMVISPLGPIEGQGHGQGLHRPAECCSSYTKRKIRCTFIASYVETTSSCSDPAVIFTTKRGKRFCADPGNEGVQGCTMILKSNSSESLKDPLLLKQRQ